MGKAILILRGGVGGLVAANELRAALSKEHRIVVVDRETTFRLFSVPSLGDDGRPNGFQDIQTARTASQKGHRRCPR